jgi:hypothetical protein
MDINALNMVKSFHMHLFLSYKESALYSTEVSKIWIGGDIKVA